MRTLVDIPEDDIRWLDDRATEQGKSRAAIVREAVSAYRADAAGETAEEASARSLAAIEAGFGAWVGHTDITDSVAWQRRERASWTRPWDDDYEEVKAEFPDLFTEQDDRERHIYLENRARQQRSDGN